MMMNTSQATRSTICPRGARWVASLEAADQLDGCGGKAFHLAQMIRLGLAVPPGIVLSNSAFQAFLHDSNLAEFVEEQLAELDVTDTQRLHEAASAIRARVTSAEFPAYIWERVLAEVRSELPDAILIVRSSAIGEDSREAAFAGQLDSIPDVCSERELHDAILACWSSYWSPRAIFYQQTRGVSLRGMGVVVQQQIEGLISGVLFTRHPDPAPGDRPALVGEYCFGRGDQLVSGHANPGRFVIDREQGDCRRLAYPERENQASDEMLYRKTRELATAGMLLERSFEAPQDIEWTLDRQGRLYFVQSRAITALARSARGSCSLSLATAGFGGATFARPTVYWSNANVNENFPEPICPLLYSIASAGYYHYFRNLAVAMGISPPRLRAMEHPLRNIIGVHGARMYYNLSHIHACLRLAPFGDLLTGWFDKFVGADSDSGPGHSGEPDDQLGSPAADSPPLGDSRWRRMKLFVGRRWRAVWESARIARRMAWHFSFLSRRVASFERAVDGFAARTNPDLLATRSLLDLRDDLAEFFDIRCHRWLNASLADSAALLSYGLFQRLIRSALTADEQGLHNSLLKGLRDIISSTPILELWELSRQIRADALWRERFATLAPAEVLDILRRDDASRELRSALEDYLERWGFRCSGELMLTVPGYQERPEPLLQILQAYVLSDGESPHDRLRRQESERAEMTSRVLQRLRSDPRESWPVRWAKAELVRTVLKWAQASIALRERARLKQALLYSRCRRIALAIGERLVRQGTCRSATDVFYLSIGEIDTLLSGGEMFSRQIAELVAMRRRWHQQLSAEAPPDAFRLPEGEYLRGSNPDAGLDEPRRMSMSNGEFVGTGACGGQVTGRAAILTDVSQCARLREGDILVTRQTDPGWAPVFFLIKGLVMERGGMLSHGAILAREYGIPTVVGVPQATQRISPGETVHVDGDRGVVQLPVHS